MAVVSFSLNLSLDILFTLVQLFGICLTVSRLKSRRATLRIWWDDYAAAVAAFFDLAYVPLMWISYAGPGSVVNSPKSLLGRYILGLQLGFISIWAARISISLTIARIFAPGDLTRTFAIAMAYLCVFFFLILSILYTADCYSRMHLTEDLTTAYCIRTLSKRLTISIATLITDTCLLATPLYSLWRLRLPYKQRRLVIAGLIAASLTALVTVSCTVLMYGPLSWNPARVTLMNKTNNLQLGISLIACNLAVLVSLISNARVHRGGLRSNAATLTLTQVTIDHTTYLQSTRQFQSLGDTHSSEVGVASTASTSSGRNNLSLTSGVETN
ncbi:hypothetical protein CPC08DRAFT_815094 [Agrocybe pediades]|nr:hypothetical protein CPC08DRAFT_815094 [Agrocybe pediades]